MAGRKMAIKARAAFIFLPAIFLLKKAEKWPAEKWQLMSARFSFFCPPFFC
jgi:hypothetical protein